MLTTIKQLFSRRSEQKPPQSRTHSNTIINRWQRRFAYVLSRHEKRLSTRQKKLILLTYCTGFGMFFGALLLKPFLSHHTAPPVAPLQKSMPLLPLDTTFNTPFNIDHQQDTIIINSY